MRLPMGQADIRGLCEEGGPGAYPREYGEAVEPEGGGGIAGTGDESDRERYSGFGPTFAAEKLAEAEGIWAGVSTIRRWLTEEGLWKGKRRGRE
ncbi:MAG: hypothetical protein LBT00_01110 [Spirochaetaceae bacterium]|jgi:hypothetical protein|nr:hypothetical protein [Spirochaetaceae bacterium]